MNRLKYSILAAAGILLLAGVLTLVGPKRVMAALGYTPVRDVTNPALQPFQIAVSFSGNSNFGTNSFTVPAGKRLVIEYVSVAMFNNGSGTVLIGPAPLSSLPSVSIPFRDPGIRGVYTGGQEVRFYGEPGQTLGVRVDFDTFGLFGGEVTIVGHLVSLP
jgi:hypothetical protein